VQVAKGDFNITRCVSLREIRIGLGCTRLDAECPFYRLRYTIIRGISLVSIFRIDLSLMDDLEVFLRSEFYVRCHFSPTVASLLFVTRFAIFSHNLKSRFGESRFKIQ